MELKKRSATISKSPFLQKHSALIRIWHWLTFITLTAQIITVLIASTALQPRANIPLVQERLSKKGVTVTDEQAFSVSHAFDDKMWDLHKLIGYGLAFLLVSRFIVEVVQPGDEKVKTRVLQAMKIRAKKDINQKEHTHFLIVKGSYFAFYLLLFIMALTGFGMAFGHDLPFLEPFHKLIRNVHSLGQYLIYGFVLAHLIGVIVADNTNAKGIVSGMINGGS